MGRVLIIEDNPTNLQLMVYLLTSLGHRALEAHEGAEGIEIAQREKPDLILLDIHMPRMDGYEVARQLRAHPHCSQIPLVAVTALAMVGDRERILAAGFDGYIPKPLDPERFPGQVNAYLDVEVRANPPALAAAEPAAIPRAAPPRTKLAVVLFVDNMSTNIEFVRSTLEPSGYQVIAAPSAREGLDLAKRTKPDLILSDVHMPHEDGFAFLRMVRGEPELAGIPFMFLSSSVWARREQDRAADEGARLVTRPIEPERLLAEVEARLVQRKSD